MPLARRPDLGLSVMVEAGGAGMRLDIGLVHRGGLELLLDDDISFGKAGIDIADLKLDPLGDVGGPGRRRLDAAGDLVLEEQWRVRIHRLVHIDDVRQHFVIDVDQRSGFLGDTLVNRGDGGDGVALIERLLACHDVARDVPEILRDPLRTLILEFVVREIGGGHHCLDARQRLRLRGIDRADAGMCVRRTDDLAVERAGGREIGAVHRPPRHLRHTVRTDRPSSNPLEPRRRNIVHRTLHSSSRSVMHQRRATAQQMQDRRRKTWK